MNDWSTMLRKFISIGWRNIAHNKVSSIINIAGLAIGIASVILISMYVQDELKYDRYYQHADRIFQVNLDGKMGGEEFLNGNTPPPVGAALVNEFPEIETYTRIYRPGDVLVRYEEGEQKGSFFTEKRVLAVDSNFLQVFAFSSMEVDPSTCLQKPNSVVITEQSAKKYFGNSQAIGKILLLGDKKTPCTVTGVLKDPPSQSSLQFDFLVNMSTFRVVKNFNWSWVWLQVSTYVKLQDNAGVDKKSLTKLEAKFPAMVRREAADAFKRIGKPFDDFIQKGGKWDLKLQPLTNVHLYSAGVSSRLTTLGSIKYVYIFSVIALFIIILACVNFMNLSTAQAAKRAKEVGIRKVLGSVKTQLIAQFLIESILYSFIATVFSLVFVSILLRPLNDISGKELGFNLLFSNQLWLYVIILSVLTGLLAGIYPAFYLTAFRPIKVLKGLNLFKTGMGNRFVRNGLVIFQFTVSTTLIISTIIVFNQLRFAQIRDLGLNKDNTIIISNSNRLSNSEESFRQELTKFPFVVSASSSSGIPTRENFGDNYIPETDRKDEFLVKDISLSSFIVDENFIPALGIQVLNGRNFSKEFSDSSSVILNETAVRQVGWKDPVGRYLEYPGNGQRFKIIAVVKDFNTQSLHNPVGPFALFHPSSKTYDVGATSMIVRVKPGNINESLSQIENKWKSFSPNTPFDFSFLDSEFEALYRSDERLGKVLGIFTFLSIFIACLGLFALATFTAEMRTKEIGIRKVLGASVIRLVAVLSRDFIILVLIASVISFPIAWWSMNSWLEDFAYRIQISSWVFIVSGISVLMIALITVGFQAFKTAASNPVKALRTE